MSKALILLLSIAIILFFLSGCKKSYLEPSYIISNSQRYADKIVTVKATPVLDKFIRCTQQICPEENPCCRACSAGLVLMSGDTQIKLVSDEIRCSGTNCEIKCSPMETNKIYIMEGVFKEKSGTYSLELEEFWLQE